MSADPLSRALFDSVVIAHRPIDRDRYAVIARNGEDAVAYAVNVRNGAKLRYGTLPATDRATVDVALCGIVTLWHRASR